MDKILLLIDHPRNRQLLKEWLGSRYTILEVIPPNELTPQFDLVIIDGVALDRLWEEIHDRKTAEQPVFVPILFLTNRKDVRMVTRHLWKSIDDIIWTPIEKIELLARVEVLLRARRFSLELEEANRIKLNFLAMISHELRTPLTSIKGFSTTLLSDDVRWSDEEQREFLETINAETNRMQELVEQLLDLSRLQAGQLSVKPVPTDFTSIIDEARSQLIVITANHHLSVKLETSMPLVHADGRRIAQVLANIIGNSCKFAPSGSTVEVRVTRQDHFVQVAVTDEGPGIPASDHDSIFEAFRQVGKSMDTKGLGLGLAIAQHIVTAHGGDIWVSDHAPGTRIIFTLPLALNDQKQSSEAPLRPA